MGLLVAAGVRLDEAGGLDPHPLPVEEPRDALLPRLGARVLAPPAGRPIVRRVRRRLLVRGDVPLVVAEHDLVVRVRDEVVRHDRDLPAAAGRIHDVLGDGVAGGVAAEPLHDLETLADRRPEVPGALDEVALVDVVRPDPDLHEPLDQVALDVDAVVDAGQEHGLVPERDAGARKDVARACQLGGDLVRMVDVDVQPDRVVFREHLAQLFVDPLGEEDRDPRADPDDLHVRDVAQPAQHGLEKLRRQRQAVAAGDQDVADLGRPADVVELGLVLLPVEVLAGVADDPRSRAVPAVAGALRGDQHQHPVRVAVDQARDR